MNCARFATSTDAFGNEVLAAISGEDLSLVPDEVVDGDIKFADADVGKDGKPHTVFKGNQSYTDIWLGCEKRARPLATVDVDAFSPTVLGVSQQMVREWLDLPVREFLPERVSWRHDRSSGTVLGKALPLSDAEIARRAELVSRFGDLSAMELYRSGGKLDPDKYDSGGFRQLLSELLHSLFWPALFDQRIAWGGTPSLRSNVTSGLDEFLRGALGAHRELFTIVADDREAWVDAKLDEAASNVRYEPHYMMEHARDFFLAAMFLGRNSLVDFYGREALATNFFYLSAQILFQTGFVDAAAMVAEFVPGNKLRAESYWNKIIAETPLVNDQAVRIFQSVLYSIGFDRWDGVAQNFSRLARLDLTRGRKGSAADNYMRAVLALRFGGSFEGVRDFIRANLTQALRLGQELSERAEPTPEDLRMLVALSTKV